MYSVRQAICGTRGVAEGAGVNILALETTGELCSVAIRDERGTLVERVFRHRMHLSERLIGDVDTALVDSGLTLDEISGFAVGLGPGSFTGIRIGVTTVKTWARLLRKPAVGIPSLDAIAFSQGMTDGLIVPLIRARPGQFYIRVFERKKQGLTPITEPLCVDSSTLVEIIDEKRPGSCTLCGEAAALLVDGSRWLEEAGMKCRIARPEPLRAGLIAEMAELRFRAGDAGEPLSLLPLYVQPPQIRMKDGTSYSMPDLSQAVDE